MPIFSLLLRVLEFKKESQMGLFFLKEATVLMERRLDRSEQKYLNTFIFPMEKSQKGRKGRRAAHVEYASPNGFSS